MLLEQFLRHDVNVLILLTVLVWHVREKTLGQSQSLKVGGESGRGGREHEDAVEWGERRQERSADEVDHSVLGLDRSYGGRQSVSNS